MDNNNNNDNINVYGFDLKPDEYQPSGCLNFSRIDNVVFTLDIQQIFSFEIQKMVASF